MPRPRSRAYAIGTDGSGLVAFASNVEAGTVYLGVTERRREEQDEPDNAAIRLTPEDAITLGAELIALAGAIRDRGEQ